MFKNQKGITLVALVITIIVLLILAGVSIAMISGDNGILTKASDAKIKDEIGAAKDEIALAVSNGLADYYEATYVTGTVGLTPTGKIKPQVQKVVDKYTGDVTITMTDVAAAPAHTKIEIKSGTSTTAKATGKIDTAGTLTWD